jgi:hypothetical protein
MRPIQKVRWSIASKIFTCNPLMKPASYIACTMQLTIRKAIRLKNLQPRPCKCLLCMGKIQAASILTLEVARNPPLANYQIIAHIYSHSTFIEVMLYQVHRALSVLQHIKLQSATVIHHVHLSLFTLDACDCIDPLLMSIACYLRRSLVHALRFYGFVTLTEYGLCLLTGIDSCQSHAHMHIT